MLVVHAADVFHFGVPRLHGLCNTRHHRVNRYGNSSPGKNIRVRRLFLHQKTIMLRSDASSLIGVNRNIWKSLVGRIYGFFVWLSRHQLLWPLIHPPSVWSTGPRSPQLGIPDGGGVGELESVATRLDSEDLRLLVKAMYGHAIRKLLISIFTCISKAHLQKYVSFPDRNKWREIRRCSWASRCLANSPTPREAVAET